MCSLRSYRSLQPLQRIVDDKVGPLCPSTVTAHHGTFEYVLP